MSKHRAENTLLRNTLEVNRINRNTWTIMSAALWAGIFRKTQEPTALTRWADLEEEIEGIHA